MKKVKTLMMSAKVATPGLLKKTVFWNKCFDVITYVHDVSLSRDSNYIVDVVMWPTLTFLWEKLWLSHFYQNLTRKAAFSEGLCWFKLNNLRLALGMNLTFYTCVEKGLKLKGLVPSLVEVTGDKLVGGLFAPTPILNRVNFSWVFKDFFDYKVLGF